jgi:hypothetical protein
MRRIWLIIGLLYLVWGLSAQVTIQRIVVNSANQVVTRVVIDLSEKTTWSYSTDTANHQVKLRILDANPNSVSISGVSDSYLISDIGTASNGSDAVLTVFLKQPFFIETLTTEQPFKIVLDFFIAKSSYTYKEQIAQAQFYTESGKWYKASKQYAQMLREFPNQKDTNYHWGKLLIRQQNIPKAKEKLALVPATSQYYADAKARLDKLEGKITPKPAPPVKAKINEKIPPKPDPKPAVKVIPVPPQKPEKDKSTPQQTAQKQIKLPENTISAKAKDPLIAELERTVAAAESTAYNDMATIDTLLMRDSSIVAEPVTPKPKATGKSDYMEKLRSLPIWVWIIVLLVLLILFFIILDSLPKKVKKTVLNAEEPTETLGMDDRLKCKMVAKLLADGWNAKEISRELRIKLSDVNMYAKQCQMSGYDDDEPQI